LATDINLGASGDFGDHARRSALGRLKPGIEVRPSLYERPACFAAGERIEAQIGGAKLDAEAVATRLRPEYGGRLETVTIAGYLMGERTTYVALFTWLNLRRWFDQCPRRACTLKPMSSTD
jgi:hypothetical protein